MKKLVSFILAGIFLVVSSGKSFAESGEEVQKESEEKTCAEDFPRHLGNDLKDTFWNGWHLVALAGGIGLLGGLHEIDPEVQRAFQPERPLGKTFDDVMQWGFHPFVLAGETLLALGLTELVFDSPKAARTAGAMFEALMLTEVTTLVLQLATHRKRPDDSNSKAFPSAHTSGAFALAAVTEVLYGPWYGVPAFALAGLVGASRLDSNRHVLTDVGAGALLGTIIGIGTAKFHEGRYSNYFLMPIAGQGSVGLSVAKVF